MKPKDLRLGINVIDSELDATAAFCSGEGIGIELTEFAFPGNLDRDLTDRVRELVAALEGVHPVSSHGPFLDLYVTSPDPDIVRVCRERHSKALDLTAKVGASIYVAHLNSLPMITNPRYLDGFVPRLVEFWWPFADRAAAHGITIVLENLWEAGPELHKKVVSEAGHPALKASFDNGHGLVFSQASASEWIAELGPDLAHCHLHDNRGDRDDHLVIGAGIEDWPALLDALGEHAPGALVILENDSLSLNLESLKQLRRMMDAE